MSLIYSNQSLATCALACTCVNVFFLLLIFVLYQSHQLRLLFNSYTSRIWDADFDVMEVERKTLYKRIRCINNVIAVVDYKPTPPVARAPVR